MASSIVIATLNAKYIHASLGLRYLKANMAELYDATQIMEFTIDLKAQDIVEKILLQQPDIVGLGVYIWNLSQSNHVVKLLKTIAPNIKIILGGPEVSYETEKKSICQYADFIITGQADLAFAQICRDITKGTTPLNKVIAAGTPALSDILLPYAEYNEQDLKHRLLYVEASRGCPFKCEFCLSSLDKTAWKFELDSFLQHMHQLYQRGARNFKFVDRTFNLNPKISTQILQFFLDHMTDDLFIHFEVIPDHLPDSLKELIQKFPAGSLQFEVGIQTFTPHVQQLISRRQDNQKSKDNITWLIEHSLAHLHTDLIFGLPGETMQSFADSFNQLVALKPHEIQLGILKRLSGTPIIRHEQDYGLKFDAQEPYSILSNDLIDFSTMQRMVRMARFWDLIANSGHFKHSLPVILADDAFNRFLSLSDWLFQHLGRVHKVALIKLFDALHQALLNLFELSQQQTIQVLTQDFELTGLKSIPVFLRKTQSNKVNIKTKHNKRQSSHLKLN